LAICVLVKQKNINVYYNLIALAEDEYEVEINMKGIIILAFFSLFAVASLLIPVPMFRVVGFVANQPKNPRLREHFKCSI
jgi:hypothetical protein